MTPLAKWLSDTGRSFEELGLKPEEVGTLTHARKEMGVMRREWLNSRDPMIIEEMAALLKLIQGADQ